MSAEDDVAASFYYDRHGLDDDTLPIVEPLEPPSGERLTDHELIRKALPRLSARIPDDGLGKEPRQFED